MYFYRDTPLSLTERQTIFHLVPNMDDPTEYELRFGSTYIARAIEAMLKNLHCSTDCQYVWISWSLIWKHLFCVVDLSNIYWCWSHQSKAEAPQTDVPLALEHVKIVMKTAQGLLAMMSLEIFISSSKAE
jgi:hypothetical protein